MTPVLDGSATSAEPASRHGTRECPECRTMFQAVDAAQLFCCQPHRRAWNNRWTVRGAKMAPLAVVARVTRNGTRKAGNSSYRASVDLDTLIRRWAAEDAAAKPPRMSIVEYNDRRYAAGFDPV